MKRSLDFRAYLLLVQLCLTALVTVGQNLIAVQGNGNASYYTDLDSAITNAQSGDTIYLPGGAFNLNVPIDKKLHIYGAGHRPDSTLATGLSKIVNNISIQTGSDSGSIRGISMQSIRFGPLDSVHNVSFYTVERCNVSALELSLAQFGWYTNSSNNVFRENVIDRLRGGGPTSQNNLISNNIIRSDIRDFGSGNLFSNNVFIRKIHEHLIDVNSSLIENNIFLSIGGNPLFSNVSNCTFNNNLFRSIPIPLVGANNIFQQNTDSTFVNPPWTNGPGYFFTYDDNYHLLSNSPGVNAGTDGNDIGLYGGLFPWKDTTHPGNPRIKRKSTDNTADANGNLLIQFEVDAQEN